MENKPISEMTEKEILRQQLELLAEVSNGSESRTITPEELCALTKCIGELAATIKTFPR